MVRGNSSLYPSAIGELLRYESPIQYTVRLAPDNVNLGGKPICRRQAVIAVVGAANHDPERFLDPGRLDITRQDNRHLAFGWAAHYCFGAPLARLEGQIALSTILRRLRNLALDGVARSCARPPAKIIRRSLRSNPVMGLLFQAPSDGATSG